MDDLTDRLTRLAERTAPPPREDLARAVATRHRQRRRQRAGLAAVAAAVAAVVVAVPAVVPDGDVAVPVPAPAAPAAAPVDVLAFPTRGSLAGDAAFVEAVRQLPWTDPAEPPITDPGFPGVPDPPVDERRVVFAGDVAGARWALVAGRNTAVPRAPYDDPGRQTDAGALSPTAIAWFVGPPGAPPEQMQVQDVPHGADPTRPVAYSDADTGALVVVTAPGDVVEISERPQIAADASVSRTFTRVEAPDGVAVLTLTPSGSVYGRAVRYRVLRAGQEVVTTGPDGRSDPDDTLPSPSVTRLREPPPPTPADAVGEWGMRNVLASTGLTADRLPFTVLWAGDVPAPTVGTARVTVFSAVLPSGAGYVGTALGVGGPDGFVGGTDCGSRLLPAGAPDSVVATVCEVTDMSGESPTITSLVVVAPPGAASVRLYDDRDAVLADHRLTDGVGVFEVPEGLASVETLDAAGDVVERTVPLGDAVID